MEPIVRSDDVRVRVAISRERVCYGIAVIEDGDMDVVIFV